ncbi:MAG: hypothetical protein ABSE73_21440 [Planctomycetota bacterium]
MRRMLVGFALAAILGLSAGAVAAEGDKGADTKAAGETKAGTLAPKPAEAPDGVLAVLKVKLSQENRPRRLPGGKAPPKEDIFNLMASGAEVAVKIKELTATGSYVEVTGTIEESTIRVSSIKEVPKPPEPDKKRSKAN